MFLVDLRDALNPVGFLLWKRISLRKVSFALTFAVLMKSSVSNKRADLSLFFWFWAGFVLDKEDRSITRSNPYFKELFRRCGLHLYQTKVEFLSIFSFHLKIVSRNCWFSHLCFFFSNTIIQDQKGLPQELFAVKMYALTVDIPPKVHKTRSKTRSNRPQIIKW